MLRLRWAGFRLSLEDDHCEMAWHIRLRVDFAWLCGNDDRSNTLSGGLAWRDTKVHFIRGEGDKSRIKGTILGTLKISLPLSIIFAIILFFHADWVGLWRGLLYFTIFYVYFYYIIKYYEQRNDR